MSALNLGMWLCISGSCVKMVTFIYSNKMMTQIILRYVMNKKSITIALKIFIVKRNVNLILN